MALVDALPVFDPPLVRVWEETPRVHPIGARGVLILALQRILRRSLVSLLGDKPLLYGIAQHRALDDTDADLAGVRDRVPGLALVSAGHELVVNLFLHQIGAALGFVQFLVQIVGRTLSLVLLRLGVPHPLFGHSSAVSVPGIYLLTGLGRGNVATLARIVDQGKRRLGLFCEIRDRRR